MKKRKNNYEITAYWLEISFDSLGFVNGQVGYKRSLVIYTDEDELKESLRSTMKNGLLLSNQNCYVRPYKIEYKQVY